MVDLADDLAPADRQRITDALRQGYLECSDAGLQARYLDCCVTLGLPYIVVSPGPFAAWRPVCDVEMSLASIDDEALTPAGYALASLAACAANGGAKLEARAVIRPRTHHATPCAYWLVDSLSLAAARALASAWALAARKRKPLAALRAEEPPAPPTV